MTRRSRRPLVLALGLVFAAAVTVSAQGKGHGNAFGHAKTPSAPAASGAATVGAGTAAPGAGQESGAPRNFAAWLDDTSVLGRGTGMVSVGAGYWRMAGYTELDAPAVDAGFGVGRRVQMGGSVPVYHVSFPGSGVVRGMGDLYLNGKIQLRAADGSPGAAVGLAIIPLVQIASAAPEAGTSRASWGVPVAVEWQRSGWRLYGSSGYFSRGSLFGSAAVEMALTDRAWLTGTVTQARSLGDAPAAGLSRHRTDVGGGISIGLSSRTTGYITTGRTLSREDPAATRLFVSGGVVLRVE